MKILSWFFFCQK